MICWNTPLGITACRTLDLVLLLMYTPFLPRRLNKLRNSPQFIQSYDPLTKWSFDTCDIQKPHNNLVSSQCQWNQEIVQLLLQLLFIHSFLIAFWFHVPPTFPLSVFFSLLLFSSCRPAFLVSPVSLWVKKREIFMSVQLIKLSVYIYL